MAIIRQNADSSRYYFLANEIREAINKFELIYLQN